MKKRVTALLLLLAMVFSLALPAGAEEVWEQYVVEGTVLVKMVKPWEEFIVPDGITEVRRIDGSNWLERVVLPSSVEVIGKFCFGGNVKLKTVEFSEGLRVIEDKGFYNLHGLTSLTLPATLESVGDETFAIMSSLTSVRFLGADTKLGKKALYYNKKLTNVVLPSHLEVIPESLLEHCDSLTSITIPDTVTTIGVKAFADCTSLKEINIPASVTSIGAEAFAGTPWLEAKGGELVLGATLVSGKVVDGKAVIPEGVTTIGPRAFYNRKDLLEVVLPDSVKVIGKEAFAACVNMTSLTLPTRLEQLDTWAFSSCLGLTELVVPPTEKIGVGVFQVCKGLTDVVMQDGTKRVGEQMFSGCESLVRVTLPADLTEISAHAFGSCRAIESLYLPDSITTIGESSLAGKYTSITLPAQLTQVGNAVAAGCEMLDTVYYTTDTTPYNNFRSIIKGKQYTYIKLPAGANAQVVPVAYASTQVILVDGKEVTFQAYALKDEKGNATNYVKLRDLASVLNSTAAQFNVGWDGAVTIQNKMPYSPNGTEMTTPYSGDKAYQVNTAPVKLDGAVVALNGIVLTHGSGGYTYFKLRDLGSALGFNVRWNGKSIEIETGKPYTGV